ncbi:MAG: MBOAT family protein [Treponema sp.]|nr:MBOAT family protein [Treponema sp.]MBR0032465.1 MBOAT family protein [Treponema sp.]
MSFISLTFSAFFLIFISLYHLASRLKKNAVFAQQILLLLAGFVFYGFADLHFLPFLLYVCALSYIGGIFCKKRVLLVIFILADLAPLLFFKYAPNGWRAHIIFPLGLSFFTFQSISYIADCYTKKIEAERNLLTVAQFISFFPVISSGPIQRAGNLIPQFKAVHHFDYDNATDGMKLFAWGMFKKLCIADRIAIYVNYVYGNAGEQYGLALLLATVLYSFQIYCDFSGYSDMAIGVARYMGFNVGKNFDHPYLSQSVGDFWRRWHISLSSWLRDYVYIPLGGSRVALPRIYANLFITFLVSGIWHGSTWNFVIWGLLHGFYLCVGRTMKPVFERMKIPSCLKVIFTFCLVTFAWIFFSAGSLPDSFIILKKQSHIPNELLHFSSMKNEIGIKESLRTMFALVHNSCGGFTGMAKTFVLLGALFFSEILTLQKSGLEFLREKKTTVRWAIYLICLLFLLKKLPLTLSFETKEKYSTNFIYQNF